MGVDRSDDFGSRLRAARERKGLSLRAIATRTKISVAVLEALERNDISRLPGGIFSRAFVRTYANEVGLNPEVAIQEFIEAFPQDSVTAGHPPSDTVEDTELFESDRRAASSVLWILAASVLLAGGVLYLSVARGNRPPAEPDIREAAAPEPAPPDRQHAGSQPTAAVPISAVEAAPATAVTPPPPPTASGESAPVPAMAVTAATTAPSDDRLTIVLSARRPVWISATVDGQKALGRLLQTGEAETIEVTREMVITAGDAAAIRMTLNGAEARAIGKTGEVVTARLTPTNFRDYLVSR